MNFLKLFISLIIFCFLSLSVQSIENKIVVKVNNEIITSVDIIEELRYLSLLNPNIKSLTKDEIKTISKNSIIKEKIKVFEIKKLNKDLKINKNKLDIYLETIFKNLGFENKDQFELFIINNKFNIETIKHKITIEALWNELIYNKFRDKVKIDIISLKNKIINEKKNNITYLLHEILLDLEYNDYNKLKIIEENISKNGFENTALKFSKSDTSKSGGKIGWIKKNSLDYKIQNALEKLSVGQNTGPIDIERGILFLKIVDKKIEQNDVLDSDFEKELQKMINIKTNEQLSQYSNFYFNKIKKNININEI